MEAGDDLVGPARAASSRQGFLSPEISASLAIIGVLVGLAAVGLVMERNWPKLVRVILAASVYAIILLGSVRSGRQGAGRNGGLPFWPFALAGAAAGLIGSLINPQRSVRLTAAGIVLGAFLLGGFHWLAVRLWPRVMGWVGVSV